MKESPCLSCKFLCDNKKGCCAWPYLGLPWSEPESFWDDITERIEMPGECFMIDDIAENLYGVLDVMYELIDQDKDPGLHHGCKEFEMWLDFLLEVVRRGES